VVDRPAPVPATITLFRNTVPAREILTLSSGLAKPGLSIRAATNVFDCHVFIRQDAQTSAVDLNKVLDWQESRNLFALNEGFIARPSGTDGAV